ncbi:MAG: O-antigen ligase family protein [Beijerinckiaceae bacterium]|nr:O-antigen ligase family protein [Beijerinckiaceae bacterium]
MLSPYLHHRRKWASSFDAMRRESRRDYPFLVVCLALVAWAPFHFGGNTPLAWGVTAILSGAALVAYETRQFLRGESHPVSWTELKLPIILFVVCIVWIAIQLANWTPEILHAPIWKKAGLALGERLNGSISVNGVAGLAGLVRLLTAGAVFWLVVQICRDAQTARLFLVGVATIIAGYALLGLVWFALFPGHVLWERVTSTQGLVTSTFINRNSYATYAALGLVVWSGLFYNAVQQVELPSRAPLRYSLHAGVETLFSRAGIAYLLGLSLCAITLIMTGSRGGLAAAVAGMACALVLQSKRRGQSSASLIAAFGISLLGLGAALFIFGGVLGSRVAQFGFADPGRFALYSGAVFGLQESFWTGFGYSSFADVFPAFRGEAGGIWGVVNKAHNSYLDALLGLGAPVGVAFLTIFAVFAGRCVFGASLRRKNVEFPAIGAGALACAGIHAALDFSMEIQGVTLTVIAILAAGVAQSASSGRLSNRNRLNKHEDL